jgi:molecular chaperone HscB
MQQPDYFELFGLPRQFEVDMAALNAAYFKLQQEYHPDKSPDFAAKSAVINDAYKTLKNRLKRAEYMVGSDLKACPALLLEIMEYRENGNVQTAQNEVEQLYKSFASAPDATRKEIFVKIKYLTKFIEDSTQ